jgi:hypothetical protein
MRLRRRDVMRLLASGVAAATVGTVVGSASTRRGRGLLPPWRSPRWKEFAGAVQSPVASPELSITAGASSVELGTPVEVAAAASGHDRLDLAVYRLGWSDGDWAVPVSQLRNVDSDVALRPIASLPTYGWRSGIHLAVATPAGGGSPHRVAPFVVTDPTASSPIVMQVPFTTYQAYNAWGGASLYDFNSPNGRATAVELDRPFDVFDGAGFLYYGDLQLAVWLEREGYDITYATSWDTHTNPELMHGRRVFLSAFHDEYWSPTMRTNLETWLANGVHAAFLGANSIYWQVGLDRTDGRPEMRCDKVHGGPQGTFRSLGRPEHQLLGTQYESYRFPYGTAASDWVVARSDHWVYAGTGLADGDRIERLVGYEWDRLPNDPPAPGVIVLANSPVDGGGRHHACIVEREGAGIVFNAGTNYWPRLLIGGGHWQPHPIVAQITRNLIDRLTDTV